MGISTTDEMTGEPVAPGEAFFTIQNWLARAKWGYPVAIRGSPSAP